MTDTESPVVTGSKPKFSCRVVTLTGMTFDMSSLMDWPTFLKIAVADGFIMTESAIINWDAIAFITRTDIKMEANALMVASPAGQA